MYYLYKMISIMINNRFIMAFSSLMYMLIMQSSVNAIIDSFIMLYAGKKTSLISSLDKILSSNFH